MYWWYLMVRAYLFTVNWGSIMRAAQTEQSSSLGFQLAVGPSSNRAATLTLKPGESH